MNTKEWFQVCKPNPTIEQATIQAGVHIEEFGEFLDALGWHEHADIIFNLADRYKRKDEICIYSVNDCDKVELLDSIIDQNVTGQGICHTLGLFHEGALREVERSNASKLEDGKPVFDKNGKIGKGKDYTPPNLKPYI